ncbi:MAG: hypothetical protein ABSE56_24065 [Bryobacteraceae bacterium]|jgi:hypothetical protein
MSSQLKIETNRRNAQLSTGPKTPEGKAKVATNSCTHGLCSRNAILPEEDPAEFHALLAGLIEEFQPANAYEESLVRELASAEWRLRRIVRLETGIFVSAMENVREYEKCRNTAPLPNRTPEEQRYDQNTRLLGLTFRQHCGGEAFTKLTRYENSIRRAYYKALKELKSPPPPRIAKTTEQSQIPPPPDPDPPPQLPDTATATEGLPSGIGLQPCPGGCPHSTPKPPRQIRKSCNSGPHSFTSSRFRVSLYSSGNGCPSHEYQYRSRYRRHQPQAGCSGQARGSPRA